MTPLIFIADEAKGELQPPNIFITGTGQIMLFYCVNLWRFDRSSSVCRRNRQNNGDLYQNQTCLDYPMY